MVYNIIKSKINKICVLLYIILDFQHSLVFVRPIF
nr:MAG TPA: hypothetical protein [Caudoviricetes sp.]